MVTPPTRVLDVTPAIGWASTATPKVTPTFDVQAGDLLVLLALTEDSNRDIDLPTWTGSGDWVLRQSVDVTNYTIARIYTCQVIASAVGRTVSLARRNAGDAHFSFLVSVWRNHGGLGISGKSNASGAPSLVLLCSANSAVVVASADWNAVNGASRTWRSINGSPMQESSYGGAPGVSYVTYTGYKTDVGTAGNKTLGLSAPSGQKYSMVGIEILGKESSQSHSGTVNLNGKGFFEAIGSPKLSHILDLSSVGTLESSGKPHLYGSSELTALGSLSYEASISLDGQVSYVGTGTLSLTGAPEIESTGTSTGIGVLSLEGSPNIEGEVALSGSGTLSMTDVPTRIATLELSGIGEIIIEATPGFTAETSLSAAGILDLSASPTIDSDIVLSSEGQLRTLGSIQVNGSTYFIGKGTLASTPLNPFVDITVSGALEPRNKSGKLVEQDRTGKLHPRRWVGEL